ncbi:hypothetical protein EYR41_001424 [Orbilia oligospora]|uniref:Uncharacterized protein n=1 Tax=Orbilia oligospora TaxID=2813651 RepID=A0A7C8PEB5_ORBOL|nr:hypothetical protein TWF751_009722 [Orbilia oligospora]TGJ74416.1 hypothetical protein EYR41_001424 [Orbilia oligospora]
MHKPIPIRRITPLTWVIVAIFSLAGAISIYHGLTSSQRDTNFFDRINIIKPSEADTTQSVQSNQNVTVHDEPEEEEDRPLVLYAYHETDNARENLLFFIKHGLHAEADFIFILNGPTTIKSSIPVNKPNIRITERNNTCFDLGAHAQVLKRKNKFLIQKYKKFILMNASVRGPFLPTWSRECWTDTLLAKVTDKNKLVGISYNCNEPRHVQSMVLATDRIGLSLLFPKINRCFNTLGDAVTGETSITGAITQGGYNVTALMTAFRSSEDYANTCTHGDIYWDKSYYGITVHPYEVMFQKANRDNDPDVLARFTEWTDGMQYNSWAVCRRAANVRKAVREMKRMGSELDFGM